MVSQENVEIVKTAIEALNRRDMRVLAELSQDDLEITSDLTAYLRGATYRGTAAWTNYVEAMDEMWKEWRIEGLEACDGGQDRVACRSRLVGKGKLSGVPIEVALGLTYQLLQGGIWRVRFHLDPAEAFVAVRMLE